MTEYALILVSTVLVNNFVLVKFLGLCPFMGFRASSRPRWAWAGDHVRADPVVDLQPSGQ